MRFKWKNEVAGGRVLEVECDRGDELTYVDAERVQRGDLSSFLPFACRRAGKSYEIAYAVGSCVSLNRMLDAPLSPDMLRTVMGSILQMMQQCEENGLSRLRVVFDPEYVLFDCVAGVFRFVYVPMRELVSSSDVTSLLECICRKATVAPNDSPFVFAAWDYACRTTALTSVGFEEFLQSWGMQAPNRVAVEHRITQRVSVEDDRGNYGWDFVSDGKAARAEQERLSAVQPSEQMPEASGSAATSGERIGAESPAAAVEQAADVAILPRLRRSNGDCYEFPDGDYMIGRSEECAICLEGSMGASRRHARLIVRSGMFSISDMNSTNGVWVNGGRIASGTILPLSKGDRFTIGDDDFECC